VVAYGIRLKYHSKILGNVKKGAPFDLFAYSKKYFVSLMNLEDRKQSRPQQVPPIPYESVYMYT
jgi:hypothetical protein